MRTLQQQQAKAERDTNRRHDHAMAPAQGSANSAQRQREPWPAEVKRTRSLELADERGGGMWAVHFVEAQLDPQSSELVSLVADVDSAHDEWVRYRVIYDAGTDTCQCDCLAGQNFAPCWHAGQIIRYGREARDAYSQAGCQATRREQALNEHAARG